MKDNLKGIKKFMVTEIREKKKGCINPVIVLFQNGEINDHHKTNLKVDLTAEENGQTNVEIETPYGHVFKNVSSTVYPVQKQIIAIRNKRTNKVKLVEADRAILINSALLEKTDPNPTVTVPSTATATDYIKETMNLNKTFGGKKITSRLEQREKLNLSSLPIPDDVKKAVEGIVEENRTLRETERESIMYLLPPCHRNAIQVSDIYVLEEILAAEELQALKEQINVIQENKFNPNNYSEFFMQCYTKAKSSDDNINNKLAGALYIECIINFLKIPTKKLSSKSVELCAFSSVIHQKLLDDFCIKTEASVTRPQTMKDKSLCYIIAIALICCNYQVNLKLLSLTTKVHLNKLVRLARVVGVTPLTKDEFVLKLPLPPLPKSSKGRIVRK